VGEVTRRLPDDRTELPAPSDVSGAPPPDAISPLSGVPPVEHGKPSVAVLPFVNVDRQPDSDYFSYGLTEDVIRLLGRHRWLTVLTRHSTASYRGQEIDPSQVGATLGVRYIVRGSVRRKGEHVRISAELIDSADGRQLWSEIYDLDLADIFDIQEALAQQIAAIIEPELASIERERAVRQVPESLDAWDCYQRGLYNLWGFTTPGFAEAERMFRRAIDLQPTLARAHAGLSYVHLQMAFYDSLQDRAFHLEAALDAGRRAVSLDDRDSLCHCVLGRAYCLHGDYRSAIAALQNTIELNPSFAQGYFALAFTLVWSGDPEQAIALIEQATELSPRDPHLWTFHLTRAYAHFSLLEDHSAEQFARRATQHPSATHVAFATLASILGLMDQREAAAEAVRLLLAKRPGYSLTDAEGDFFFCARTDFVDRFVKGLEQAGLPV
jgi:TolB-like protein/Flp pilus assembly protein TadD